jgi:mono/diheme cytochrome c family protein
VDFYIIFSDLCNSLLAWIIGICGGTGVERKSADFWGAGKGISQRDDSKGICPQERNTPQAPEPFYKMTNPLEPTSENLRAGETLFKIDAGPTACKVCHGYGGDGLGVIFEQLTPKPRNFTCYYMMDDIPDGQIYWIIKNGSPGTKMPSFGALSDTEVWQLVLFIRQFSKKFK